MIAEAVRFDPFHYRSAAAVQPLLQAVDGLVMSPAFARGIDSSSSANRWRVRTIYASALQMIGQYEVSGDTLRRSVEVWRQAVADAPRATVPLKWAQTQDNLGVALESLGARTTTNSQRLEESVAIFRAALEERTRERFPLEWATTQFNLGDTLLELAKRGPSEIEHCS